MAVVETPRFLKDAAVLLAESERAALVSYLGSNPEAGDLIPDSGGVRKLQWALPGRGKRGGARVIYYFHGRLLPLFLLAMYGKGERATLTEAERATNHLTHTASLESVHGSGNPQ